MDSVSVLPWNQVLIVLLCKFLTQFALNITQILPILLLTLGSESSFFLPVKIRDKPLIGGNKNIILLTQVGVSIFVLPVQHTDSQGSCGLEDIIGELAQLFREVLYDVEEERVVPPAGHEGVHEEVLLSRFMDELLVFNGFLGEDAREPVGKRDEGVCVKRCACTRTHTHIWRTSPHTHTHTHRMTAHNDAQM